MWGGDRRGRAEEGKARRDGGKEKWEMGLVGRGRGDGDCRGREGRGRDGKGGR